MIQSSLIRFGKKELTNKLRQAILECDKNPSVKCSILTGAGKAFCAGIDLKEFGAGRGIDPRARQNAQGGGEGQPDVAPHWLMNGKKKPIIAAVNGPTITGGLEVALNCDFIIASEHATFADTHARVGVMPGGGLTVLLPQWIGLPRARQMSITGNFVNAKQALEWGLANEVVPEAELLPRCKALAAAICQIDPKAVTQMLDTYEDTTGGTAKDAWQVEQTKKSGF